MSAHDDLREKCSQVLGKARALSQLLDKGRTEGQPVQEGTTPSHQGLQRCAEKCSLLSQGLLHLRDTLQKNPGLGMGGAGSDEVAALRQRVKELEQGSHLNEQSLILLEEELQASREAYSKLEERCFKQEEAKTLVEELCTRQAAEMNVTRDEIYQEIYSAHEAKIRLILEEKDRNLRALHQSVIDKQQQVEYLAAEHQRLLSAIARRSESLFDERNALYAENKALMAKLEIQETITKDLEHRIEERNEATTVAEGRISELEHRLKEQIEIQALRNEEYEELLGKQREQIEAREQQIENQKRRQASFTQEREKNWDQYKDAMAFFEEACREVAAMRTLAEETLTKERDLEKYRRVTEQLYLDNQRLKIALLKRDELVRQLQAPKPRAAGRGGTVAVLR